MAINTRTFSDLDLGFTIHPNTGDLNMKYDADAIKQSIKNLVMTNHYERPFHPEIGSQVRGLLFELYTPLTAISIRQSIINTINNYEPRAKINYVKVLGDDNNHDVLVTINFSIINTVRPIELNIALERTR